MTTDSEIHDRIERAAETVGRAWPLHSFVTANPLSGLEDRPFPEAVAEGRRLFSASGYPSAAIFRRAYADGRIDPDRLNAELSERGYDTHPESLLDRIAAADDTREANGTADEAAPTPTDRVDGVVTKWLAAFTDQGQSHWSMPGRERGFYAAVRRLAPHDREIPDCERLSELPDDPGAALVELLAPYPDDRWTEILEHHLAALPGWTAVIRGRIEDDGAWQSAHPITLAGYLAVRLAVCDALDAPIDPGESAAGPRDPEPRADDDLTDLREAWLSAWEATYRRDLVEAVADADAAAADDDGRPDAQLVFCIDTRSEIIRRHVEAAGDYETYGYAGFFGIPMEHEGYDVDVTAAAHPPILDADHRIADRPTDGADARAAHDRWSRVVDAGEALLDALGSNAATAFSFVESTGPGYGAAMAARTLFPGRVFDLLDAVDRRVPDVHEFCAPTVDGGHSDDPLAGMALDEAAEYAATAFELMGWEEFARVVAFVGHASQTANNPFGSSLDCGACAGNPGGPNARVLAAICNDAAVRERLRDRGIEIPAETVFVAGEHNTTTDEIELYDDGVPASHRDDVEALRADLATARAGAAAERAADMGVDVDADANTDAGVRETTRRAADWAETRPEWGLAGNAGFVIGPRALTDGLDLDGRSFLHSYDWRTDPDGDALEAILTGPMVVTQWINTQYYFATVDNAAYGSGSKVTHNPVGNVGVYQGNGGDLLPGLPKQSVMGADADPYHQPLRLSTVVHAPVDRVTEVLSARDGVRDLLDNGWLSLTVVDPERDGEPLHYAGDLEWTSLDGSAPATRDQPEQPVPAADD